MNSQDIRNALAADELDAWARHAHRANGFGDAALPLHPKLKENFHASLAIHLIPSR